MTNFLSSFIFSINTTLPIIILLCLGKLLGKCRILDDAFSEKSMKLIFHLTLPLLLFFNIYNGKIEYSNQFDLIFIAIVGTTILFLVGEWLAAKFIIEKRERCTFVQAVFRGNNAILGLALCINAYGDVAYVPASIYSAIVVILFNVYGVITITRSLSSDKVNIARLLLNILKNPLIIAIILGLVMNYVEVSLPKPVRVTGQYLANITLPLALLCIGASIQLNYRENYSRVVTWSVVARLVIAPLFMVLLAKLIGMSGMELAIIFLMTTTPLATAAYAMVKAMGGNGTTVANIIGITTIGAMPLSSLGLMILMQLGWI
ncbi:AEC family transporter [Actinobacillus porcinus]|uniref:Auxin efflux carrier n=1 Tax=Actinobacillus porcinus TaxID=51048 RepID=A0ABY6TLQ7_9PAST|nr:AEC family transporter [Actinobacillus porcinus]MDD7545732.1 AEC family transporter [Actinobacillus porcinus]MDY5847860.1 AEC family transporter [Actinobacillus porcinus]VFY93868.1 auxin efflux carrier [Actinobacillus porcinus]VTU09304.1 auxin efflux carrier [Actinobacillus porcinus]